MRRFVVGLLIFVSALALLLSSTSLWARQNVIDTGGFLGNAEAIIDQPQVQARLASGTADRIMKNPQVQTVVSEATAGLPPILQRFRPTVSDGVRTLITTGATQLLAAQPFRPLARAALTSAHDQLVNGQAVRFTLGQAKDRLPDTVKTGLAGQVLDLIPSDAGVTLVSPSDAPTLYLGVNLLKVTWWVAGLVALLALAGALLISHRRRRTLRAWAVTLSVLIVLLLAALRVGREVLITQVRPVNRGAIGAVYDGIAASARVWTLWVLAAALVIILVTSLWGHLGLMRAIRRGSAAAAARSRERKAQAELAAGTATTAALATGPEPEAPPSWWARTVDGVRGLGSPETRSAAGGFVRAHLAAFRWGVIVLGAVVLLLWQSPNLSVLIWIVALVAIVLAVFDWLTRQAPEPVPADTEPAAVLPPDGGQTEPALALAGSAPAAHNGHEEKAPAPVLVAAASSPSESTAPPTAPMAPMPAVAAAAPVAEAPAPVAPAPVSVSAPPLPDHAVAAGSAGLLPSPASTPAPHVDKAVHRGDTNVKFAQLRDLADLRASGVLSEAEFEAEKRDILQA